MHHPDPNHAGQDGQDIRNRLLLARLPAMPQILIRLIEHLQADDLGMAELAALVAQDAAMAGKILRVASSSAYTRNHVRLAGHAGLEQALVTLGTDTIKTLVISESVFQTFNSFPHSGSLDLRRFWKQSLSAAVIARELARRMQYAQVEEAYLAGLLHNVGRLALLAAAPREYAFNFSVADDEDLCAVEQRTLQITHAEAGAWLIERWQFDSFLSDAVLYHHEASSRLEAAHPLIRIVRVAHLLSAHGVDAPGAPVLGEAVALCALNAADIGAIAGAAARQVEQAAAHLGIDLAGADDAPPPSASAAPAADRVQQRLQEEVRNMVLVSEAGQSFARQHGEAGLLDAVTRSARILFDLNHAVVLLENPTGQALVGVPSAQFQRVAELAIPLSRGGAIAACAAQRTLTVVERDAPHTALAEEQLLRILGCDALVCVPLVAGARCLGVLVGGVAAWQLPHCRKRARFMQAFGAQAAQALEAALSERGHARRQLAHVAEEYRQASRRVAHEVNNPLSIIKNYLSVLDDKLARREPVVGELSVLNEEIDRVGQLIGGLVDLQPAGQARATDVNQVIGEVQRLFRASNFVPAGVAIEARPHLEQHLIAGDADILKQILVNLAKNAVEALAEQAGGRIELANRGHVNRERRMYVELAVCDNGPGLAPDVLGNLFAPVRSAKPGEHRGLGLSIVHSLVNKLDGLVSCRSSAQGTTFEILLPAHGPVEGGGAPRALSDNA
ncbi:MAG: HDOD domain-containing protein [Gammaproteobacteria bacterium]